MVEKVTPIILTGGLGTRLRQVVVNTPKTMAQVAGRPFLEYILEQLQAASFKKVVLCVGYLSDQIQKHFGDTYQNLQITYSVENTLLGTAGAVRFALEKTSTQHLLVMNGDSFCAQPLDVFVQDYFTLSRKASIAVTEVTDTQRYGRVNFDQQEKVTSFDEKGSVQGSGWINAGLYIFNRQLIAAIPAGRNISMEKQIFPDLTIRGELYAYKTSQRTFIDIGTPESFIAADKIFSNWTVGLRPQLCQSSEAIL